MPTSAYFHNQEQGEGTKKGPSQGIVKFHEVLLTAQVVIRILKFSYEVILRKLS